MTQPRLDRPTPVARPALLGHHHPDNHPTTHRDEDHRRRIR
nr:hypothetical protein [Amycolatopsis sp. FDAARGOS 1241]